MFGRATAVALAALMLVLSGCGSPDEQKVGSGTGGPAGVTSQPTNEPGKADVGDSEGRVRGAIDLAEKKSRAQRVVGAAIAGGYITADREPEPKLKQQMINALYVLDPLDVRDSEGERVGYFTTEFVELADYPAVRKAAEVELEQFEP